jgi:hypothetical protein
MLNRERCQAPQTFDLIGIDLMGIPTDGAKAADGKVIIGY